MKALVLDGKVIEVCKKEFEVAEPLEWHDCGKDVSVGWSCIDGKFEKPPAIELTYIEKRQNAYPFVGDQLDAIMKWLSTEGEFNIPAELKSIAMRCMSVKAKYPKPEEKK